MFYVADYMTGKIVSGPFPTLKAASEDKAGMAIEEDCVILHEIKDSISTRLVQVIENV